MRTALARVAGNERARDCHERGAVDAIPAWDGGGSFSGQGLSARAHSHRTCGRRDEAQIRAVRTRV